MKPRSEKDFWIEMSIREIWTQCKFAKLAYQNIHPNVTGGTDGAFSSIHSFLSHCTNVSKLLKASNSKLDQENPDVIEDILGIGSESIIHSRRFRNHLEHYDERLKNWIHEKGMNANIGTYNIGPKSAFDSDNMLLVIHYDPQTTTFTFVDEGLNLSELHEEVVKIQEIADKWVSKNAYIF